MDWRRFGQEDVRKISCIGFPGIYKQLHITIKMKSFVCGIIHILNTVYIFFIYYSLIFTFCIIFEKPLGER